MDTKTELVTRAPSVTSTNSVLLPNCWAFERLSDIITQLYDIWTSLSVRKLDTLSSIFSWSSAVCFAADCPVKIISTLVGARSPLANVRISLSYNQVDTKCLIVFLKQPPNPKSPANNAKKHPVESLGYDYASMKRWETCCTWASIVWGTNNCWKTSEYIYIYIM